MKKSLPLLIIVCVAFACKKQSSPGGTGNPPLPGGNTAIAKGADISWLTEMEAAGRKFYTSTGAQQDCIQLLKDLGFNSIRLRVWVNPSNGWCNTADVVAKAVRAKALGMKILLNFHYSDSWADPGKQTKPLAWAAQSFTDLKQSVATHTTDVLNALKASGVTPAWVQIGNETNDGMLWPDGRASTNMANYAQLILTGYNAVKAIDTSMKVIVHVSNGQDNDLFRWNLDGLKNNGAKWDITGMSLYPTSANWQTFNTQCLANMNDMVSRHNKDVMVVEIGMSWDQAAACKSFIADLITKIKSVTGSRGLGVFYWEPESYNNWQGYTLGAFDNSGKPTMALDAFK